MYTKNTISHPSCFNRNSGRTQVSTQKASVEQCLRLLFTSSKGELLGDPFYGTNLMMYKNEPNDLVLQDMIVDDFVSAAKKYETRVEITQDDFTFVIDANKLYISINYRLVDTGTEHTFELSVLRGE